MAVKSDWISGEDYTHTAANAVGTQVNANETAVATKAATNTGVSVDGEVAVYSGTTGKLLKRSTTTGIGKLTSGVLSAAVEGTDYYDPGGTDVSVVDGGTGSSTASGARTNLGAAASATTITGATSVAGGGDLSTNRTLTLVNDSATPGNSKYYGTDGAGAKGFYDLPAGAGGGIAATIVDAKGDSIVATAADTVAREAVGANGTFLKADSTQTTGRAWANVTKTDVGLSNVDNVSDANKPVSTAQAAANTTLLVTATGRAVAFSIALG